MARQGALPYCAMVKTDVQGRFTVPGVMPGRLMLTLNPGIPVHTWLLDVPEEGLQDVMLRQMARPPQLVWSTSMGERMVWWIPDAGRPVGFPLSQQSMVCHNLPLGRGYLWDLGQQGHASYQRLVAAPGRVIVGAPAPGPTLGLVVPCAAALGVPAVVTLTGLDDRAGIEATVTGLLWQISPQLGAVVSQIDAVPPGRYRVTVSGADRALETVVTVEDGGGMARFALPE